MSALKGRNILLYKVFAAILLSSLFCNCYDNSRHDIFKAKIARITFFDADSQKNLVITTEIAESEYARARGLMYRKELPENGGMLFVYKDEKVRNFWMKNTPLSLDILYLNANLEIIKIHSWTIPYSERLYSSELPAQYVLEVNGGFTDHYRIRAGNSIKWELL